MVFDLRTPAFSAVSSEAAASAEAAPAAENADANVEAAAEVAAIAEAGGADAQPADQDLSSTLLPRQEVTNETQVENKLKLDQDEVIRYLEPACEIALGDYHYEEEEEEEGGNAGEGAEGNAGDGGDGDGEEQPVSDEVRQRRQETRDREFATIQDRLLLVRGNLYITNQRIVLLGNGLKCGVTTSKEDVVAADGRVICCDFSLQYDDMALHAFGEDSSLYPKACVYLQLGATLDLLRLFKPVFELCNRIPASNSVSGSGGASSSSSAPPASPPPARQRVFVPEEDVRLKRSREVRFAPTRLRVSDTEAGAVPDVFRSHFQIAAGEGGGNEGGEDAEDEDSDDGGLLHPADARAMAQFLSGNDDVDVAALNADPESAESPSGAAAAGAQQVENPESNRAENPEADGYQPLAGGGDADAASPGNGDAPAAPAGPAALVPPAGPANPADRDVRPPLLLFRFLTAASIEHSHANPPQQLPNFVVLGPEEAGAEMPTDEGETGSSDGHSSGGDTPGGDAEAPAEP